MTAHALLIESTLADLGLDVDRVGDNQWMTVLAGEHKRALPVLLALGSRVLRVTAFFAAGVDEAHGDVYRLLLQRNQRSTPVSFALDDDGDIILVGQLPVGSLDADALDALLGRLLAVADETFNQVLRRGFATYIETEQQWRAAAGLPPNPIGVASGQEG